MNHDNQRKRALTFGQPQPSPHRGTIIGHYTEGIESTRRGQCRDSSIHDDGLHHFRGAGVELTLHQLWAGSNTGSDRVYHCGVAGIYPRVSSDGPIGTHGIELGMGGPGIQAWSNTSGNSIVEPTDVDRPGTLLIGGCYKLSGSQPLWGHPAIQL